MSTAALPRVGERWRIVGPIDPITQRRGRNAGTVCEVTEAGPEHVRLRCPGCYPPHGFKVRADAWAELWQPNMERATA